MSAGWGFVGAALSFSLLDVFVQNKGGPAAVTGAFGTAAKIVGWWVDPTKAAIPDRSSSSSSSSSPSSSSAGAKSPANAPPTPQQSAGSLGVKGGLGISGTNASPTPGAGQVIGGSSSGQYGAGNSAGFGNLGNLP